MDATPYLMRHLRLSNSLVGMCGKSFEQVFYRWSGQNIKPGLTFKSSVVNFDIISEEAGFSLAPYFTLHGIKLIQLYSSQAQRIKHLEN